MTECLYPNFLDDPAEYEACEKYWQRLVTKVAAAAAQHGEWTPWIPRHYPNGTPVERDGTPICDGRSLSLNRAFRIIQHPCSEAQFALAAWVKTYEQEFTDLPQHELVINLSLSRKSSELAERLLTEWMAPATTFESMQSFVSKVVPAGD